MKSGPRDTLDTTYMYKIFIHCVLDLRSRISNFNKRCFIYYEIVNEARSLSGFFPTDADFITEMHFNHETIKAIFQVSERSDF